MAGEERAAARFEFQKQAVCKIKRRGEGRNNFRRKEGLARVPSAPVLTKGTRNKPCNSPGVSCSDPSLLSPHPLAVPSIMCLHSPPEGQTHQG